MRKRVMILFGMLWIMGILMGMSQVQEKPVTTPVLSVQKQVQPELGRDIYNGWDDITILLSVNEGTGQDVASGMHEIQCRAVDATGYEKQEHWQVETGQVIHYTPDLAIFADGQITFSFLAVDQAGNSSEEQQLLLEKDSTRPVITGRISTKGQKKDRFYSDTCVWYLSVQDENFDFSCQPVVETDASEGYSFSGWQKRGNQAVGALTFYGEGTYQATFSCADLAGNQSETMIIPEFVIDRTAPMISVAYEEEEAMHERYYNQARKACITVKEKWFAPENGTVTVDLNGTKEVRHLSDWKETPDGYTAELLLEKEGVCALSITWVDLAGNQAKAYHSGAFIIDRTAPTAEITGVEANSSNNGKVEPIICISDNNMDKGEVSVELKELTGKKVEMPSMKEESISDEKMQLCMENFGDAMDGIYRLTVTARDLAGNQCETSLSFSVNRKGSDYAWSAQTEKLFQEVFLREPEKVVILEQNVDWITDSSLVVSYNGDVRELDKDQDYTLQTVGSETDRKAYTYTINEKCFEKEGTYVIYVDSVDRAGNHSAMDQAGERAGFIIDRTAPEIRLINLEEYQYYHEQAHNFQVTVGDNTELDTVKYYIDGRLEETFSAEDIAQMEGLLELQTATSEEYQTIQIIAEDKAGNKTDSGEWHVLVNTTERTKKDHTGRSGQSDEKKKAAVDEKVSNRSRQSLIIAAGICAGVTVMAAGWYWYKRKKEASIRRLPDTDDRK